MKTHHSTARTCLALMIGILLSAFAACKKSPESIGNNLISENNYIGVYHTDTAEIVCHSYLDSIMTKNATYALLGAMNDPVFGTTEAGFYTQFRFSVAGQNFGSNPVLDSLVLQLYLGGYYGDTTVMQTARVYKLTDSLSLDATYYNHSTVATEMVDHANGFQFCPHPRTKIHVLNNDTVGQPVIRIPLSQELGEFLMNLDTTAYSRPDLFKKAFPGLYVTCDAVSQNGSVSYINLTSSTFSMLQLYYHNAATPDKPMRYNYHVTSYDTYFNHFDHDYTQGSTEFVSQVLDKQWDLGQSTLYLQTMGGVRAPPVALILLGFNADSTTYLLPDYYEGSGFFGGTYNASTQSVAFRISEYLQSMILEKKENLGLSLGINGAAYNAQRWIVNGPEAETGEKMRLEVTYSLVNE